MNQINDLKKENNILGGSLVILVILGVIVSYFGIKFYLDKANLQEQVHAMQFTNESELKKEYDELYTRNNELFHQMQDANNKMQYYQAFLSILSNKSDKKYKLAQSILGEYSKDRSIFLFGTPDERRDLMSKICGGEECEIMSDLLKCREDGNGGYLGTCFDDIMYYYYFYFKMNPEEFEGV